MNIRCFCNFVYDGDTIAVDQKATGFKWVRLVSIDAPEIGQKFGRESRNSLAVLCARKEIKVNIVKIDKYGRAVAQVLVDGVDASVHQARLGMAFPYFLNDINRMEIMIASAQAKEARLGVWGVETIMLPSEFRRWLPMIRR